MTIKQLQSKSAVRRLIEIQEELGLKDIPFAETVRLGLHGANWGKIKAGTYTGSTTNALAKLEAAVAQYEKSRTPGIVEDGVVILDHVEQALDAVEIARANDDEHRLVVVVGVRGNGKTRTLSVIRSRYPGGYAMSARPSWTGSYVNFLNNFAQVLGLPESRSAGAAETAILNHLMTTAPGVITIDEFNHFSGGAINFIKAILNETRWVVVTATIPHHLSRMAADRSTAQESVQLLRRAVAIIHIPQVTAVTVEQIQRNLYPQIPLGEHTNAIMVAANGLHRLDSVAQILEDSESTQDIPAAIARHQRACQVTLKLSA
jgi:DNA transposition AAA+ family ATPase